ncbi:constitutive coactivator of PPAR-gamma-like protein 2 [Lates japonicus]|uniref:Constitutive coactivator of PPAR-gamma-like protein 2 n=1 Tax=Lates japonicus TaxID=270547 RepID=A0AAD3NHV1_LATJO|nr:constitutive coactivator of PPAR-gamma-like protein 2 [Lates japonicus]
MGSKTPSSQPAVPSLRGGGPTPEATQQLNGSSAASAIGQSPGAVPWPSQLAALSQQRQPIRGVEAEASLPLIYRPSDGALQKEEDGISSQDAALRAILCLDCLPCFCSPAC